MTDPVILAATLGQQAAVAQLEAHRLAVARLEPGMPLSDYLQPLQNLTGAIVATASTASLLADMAAVGLIDPDDSAAAAELLRKAERIAHAAGDQASHAFDDIRRGLRLAGLTVPYLGGLERLRRYRTTYDALADLSAAAERAAGGSPLSANLLIDPASNLAVILARLGQAAWKLRAGIDDAYDRLPAARSRRADYRVGQGSQALKRAADVAKRAVSVITEAAELQRKAAAW